MTDKQVPVATRFVTVEFSFVALKYNDRDAQSGWDSDDLDEEERTAQARHKWEMHDRWGWHMDIRTGPGQDPVQQWNDAEDSWGSSAEAYDAAIDWFDKDPGRALVAAIDDSNRMFVEHDGITFEIYGVGWFDKTSYTWKIDYNDQGLLQSSAWPHFWPSRNSAALAGKAYFDAHSADLVTEAKSRLAGNPWKGPGTFSAVYSANDMI